MAHGFVSAAHRRALFAEDPALAHAIARKYGAKVGGGYTKKQLEADPLLAHHRRKATDPDRRAT